MKCYHCGCEMPDGATHCLNCGRKRGDIGMNDGGKEFNGGKTERRKNGQTAAKIALPYWMKLIFGLLSIAIAAAVVFAIK